MNGLDAFITTYLTFATDFMLEMHESNATWKKRIREDWEKTKKYPRKKKKRIRKDLLISWSIASYDPFKF
jgi:hypothetical protein